MSFSFGRPGYSQYNMDQPISSRYSLIYYFFIYVPISVSLSWKFLFQLYIVCEDGLNEIIRVLRGAHISLNLMMEQ